ncbi:hypothetical protein NL676_030694 [Syzygium grande]|nr:hypothetical protein NL676_030694 [Syzygium grande]
MFNSLDEQATLPENHRDGHPADPLGQCTHDLLDEPPELLWAERPVLVPVAPVESRIKRPIGPFLGVPLGVQGYAAAEPHRSSSREISPSPSTSSSWKRSPAQPPKASLSLMKPRMVWSFRRSTLIVERGFLGLTKVNVEGFGGFAWFVSGILFGDCYRSQDFALYIDLARPKREGFH